MIDDSHQESINISHQSISTSHWLSSYSSPPWGVSFSDLSVYQVDCGVGGCPSYMGKGSKQVSFGLLAFSATYVMVPKTVQVLSERCSGICFLLSKMFFPFHSGCQLVFGHLLLPSADGLGGHNLDCCISGDKLHGKEGSISSIRLFANGL